MQTNTSKINNFKVADLTQTGNGNVVKPHKYAKLFPNQWFNMYICSKKRSGKTNLIYNILKQIVDRKKTFIFIYCSTVDKDETYIKLVEYFKSIGVNIFTNTSILNEDPDNCEFSLETVVSMMAQKQEQDQADDDEELIEEKCIIKLNDTKKKRRVKPKPIIHDYVIILDDLSNETRNKEVSTLMKKNRHFRSRIIISSQYANDLAPDALKQVDYFLLLGGHSDDKLELIYKHGDSSLELVEFIDLYRNATAKKYDFLYYDTANESYRKNFDEEYRV